MHPIEIVLLAVVVLLLIGILALLRHGRTQAAAARARSAEVDRLATLGAETLNAARAEDALIAVAEVIRGALRADWCAVFDHAGGKEGEIALAASSPHAMQSNAGPPVDRTLVQWVAEEGIEAAVLADGTTRVGAPDPAHVPAVAAGDVGVRAWVLPLRVRDRTVGVLAIGAQHDLRIERAERRVLRALSHYAALGVERVRLVHDADRAEALREADRVKDALLASVSHDLRTPLTAIKGLANEIARSGDDRAVMIEEEADRLNRFVGQLLDLSRVQAGGAGRAPEANEAEDLVGAALQRIAGRSEGREIRPTIRAPSDALLIGRFDFSDTLRALVNLLENALKYSAPDTLVELIVSRDGPWLSFAVADRGPGVPAGERERIFDPFYRPPGALADSGSSGLGLTIARRLAEAQRGSVTVEARADGGSVFTLRVPALDLAELAAT
jgi:two-component system sensor histidine kinase KdpD